MHQQTLNGAAAGKPPSEQPGRKHPGVVQYDEIALPQGIHQPGKGCVFELSRIPMQHEKPRAAAQSGRLLRDQLIGKVEIEVNGIQWPSSCTASIYVRR